MKAGAGLFISIIYVVHLKKKGCCMKQVRIFIIVLLFSIPFKPAAQEIIYSEFNNEDNRDINFEILGKMNDDYLIYKNVKARHVIAIYDNQMRIKNTVKLGFVPEKTFNIEFILYTGYFYMIYQYPKGKAVYCMGVKMGADGSKLSEPVQLDSSRVPILADYRIYGTTYSQDKQRIMIYKMQKKNQSLSIVTKLFDSELNMLDSTRIVTPFDEKREEYSDVQVDNDGGLIFAKTSRSIFRDNTDGLDIYFRKPGAKDYKVTNIDLQGKYIDEVMIKVDNINKRYLLNSLYYIQQRSNIKGLYTLLIDAPSMDTLKSVFNAFPDSIRDKASTSVMFRAAFDDYVLRQAIMKKDGGFLLATEDLSMQTRSGNGNWTRSGYLYNSPSYSANDYYISNPSYNYYRGYNGYYNNYYNNSWQTVRYYCDNVLFISVDKNMNIEWNTILPKSQADDDTENYLSFTAMNIGGEIHILYNETERSKQIVNNQSILPGGEIKRYATLKSREAGYEFMPRFSKQVGYREILMPCVYRTNIAFARISFPE